jgi:ubiquitin-protein ligase
MSAEPVVIPKATMKRLAADVRDIYKNPLHSEGIYYHHDESDLLTGYALLIGPEDTPYSGGYYFFKISYPTDYPHSPPKFVFHTNDGAMRMHPNLYKCGKVCLSILNTWHGEQWDGCQTIGSVLITIRLILTNDPLRHEPGLDERHPDFNKYTQLVYYHNIKIAMCDVLEKPFIKNIFPSLYEDAKRDFIDKYDQKLAIFEKAAKSFRKYMSSHYSSDTIGTDSIYKIRAVTLDYKTLYTRLEKIRNKLLDSKS